MDVVLLHNPNAGNGAWRRRDLVRLVRRAGFAVEYLPLKEALAEPEQMQRGDFLAVAGGDGAVRKVALALLGHKRPIAPLPLGTANNIARNFGLDDDLPRIVKGWRKKPRHVRFDVGVAAGPWGHRHFIEGVGVGLIGRAIAVLDAIDDVAVHEWRKARHKLHRDACVAAVLAHEMHGLPVKLQADHRDRSDDFLLLEILNIRRAGPAVELAPNARPGHGKFDIVSVTEKQRGRLLHALKARLADEKHIRPLTTRHASSVEFSVGRACELRIDDGVVPLAADEAVRLTVERAAVEFLLPGK
jgi:diacylglycerol kinase family enzyme